MDKEQAIEKLNDIRCHVKEMSAEEQALVMAIEALKAQLSQEGTIKGTISRQAAIDALQKCRKHCIDPFDSYHIDIQDAENQLRKLPTIQPEPQWIPVERELPEPRIDVWVNSDLGQMTGYYDETVELWYGRDYLELIVNAWMPLPEAYKPNK